MNKLIIMLGAAVVATSVPLQANADTVPINGVDWTYKDKDDAAKTVTLGSGSYKDAAMPADTVLDASNFPWTVNFGGAPYTVTRLASYALYGCYNMSGTLTIPDGVNVSTWVFAYCTNLTTVVCGHGVASIGSKAFQGCTNLTAVLIRGPKTVTSGTQTYTEVGANDTFTDAMALKVVLCGPNTKGTDFSSMMRHVKNSKVYVPANGYWESLMLGGTGNVIVNYGPGLAYDLAFDSDTMVATPTTEQGLADVLNLAATVKSEFGLNTKVCITNAIPATSGLVTADLLKNAELGSLMFKVTTQAQLDNVLAATANVSVPVGIDPDGDKHDVLTLPADRKVWVLLSGNGKYVPKINGLIISFH